MTTAEALEGVTDPGLFEILGVRALRALHPECECLEHVGVNAQGKTIVGPVDSFARVPGSDPSRYVSATFTIAARGELRRKWYALGASGPIYKARNTFQAGDLIKACVKAEALRASEPESAFAVYLCTNQRLDDEIMAEGYAIGRQHSVEVVFVGQSRLRDFLDSARGQPVREKTLGIRSVDVSRELLEEICRISLTRYRGFGLSDSGLVETVAWHQARHALLRRAPLLALVGKPGVGKTVIGQSLLERHAEGGGIGLWVPGDFLQDSRSLSEAVTLTLRQLNPYLDDTAGHWTLNLASTEHPLVLVLDDPNRTDRPGAILRKIFGWARDLWSEGIERCSNLKIVVPVWESRFSDLHHGSEGEKWLNIVSVGPMRRGESIACLRKRLADNRVSDSQLDHIAHRLRDDPILLSIFARLANAGAAVDSAAVTNRLRASYQTVLTQLARQMLLRKKVHPAWQEVREWLQPDALSSLEDIAKRGDVCHITNQGKRDVFEFRHDRILDWKLSQTIASEFTRNEPIWDAIFDPYMVEVLGRALANDEADETVIQLAAERLPASLVAALSSIPAGNDARSSRICRRVANWLRSIHLEAPSVQDDALSILENTVSEHVLTVTKGIALSRSVLLARLRNGDAFAGAAVLSSMFHPGSTFSWLENLIAQAASRFGDKLVGELADILRNPPRATDSMAGALILAGYLADPSLADAILTAWESAPDKIDLVAPALWAALRCSDHSGSPLSAILPAIFSVSDKPGVGGWSDRKELFREISCSARHGFSLEILTFLRDLAQAEEQYASFVFSLFGRIDKPICVEFVIRRIAKLAAKPVKPGHISGAYLWETQWRRTSGLEDAPMPEDCVDTLWELCQPWHPEWLRTYAFKLWVRYSGDKLWSAEIPLDLSDSETALWERANRGDRRVVDSVVLKLRHDPHWWLNGIHGIWSERFESALDDALKMGDSTAIRALRDAPADAAERLIISNWEQIRDRPFGIAAALYVARSSTVALAHNALQSDPEPQKTLRHTGTYFGFNLHGYSERITPEHLNIICPLLVFFDDHNLADVGQFCRKYGHVEWALENLVEVCRDRIAGGNHRYLATRIRQMFPTDAELISDLTRISADEEDRMSVELRIWTDRFTERSDDPGRIPRLLNEWLRESFSVSKFRLAALAVRYQGSRRSLDVLKQFSGTEHWVLVEQFYRDAEYGVMRRSLM